MRCISTLARNGAYVGMAVVLGIGGYVVMVIGTIVGEAWS